MSEEETNPQGQKPKLCRLAVASIALVVSVFLAAFILREKNFDDYSNINEDNRNIVWSIGAQA